LTIPIPRWELLSSVIGIHGSITNLVREIPDI
jgi:hypothetical protein